MNVQYCSLFLFFHSHSLCNRFEGLPPALPINSSPTRRWVDLSKLHPLLHSSPPPCSSSHLFLLSHSNTLFLSLSLSPSPCFPSVLTFTFHCLPLCHAVHSAYSTSLTPYFLLTHSLLCFLFCCSLQPSFLLRILLRCLNISLVGVEIAIFLFSKVWVSFWNTTPWHWPPYKNQRIIKLLWFFFFLVNTGPYTIKQHKARNLPQIHRIMQCKNQSHLPSDYCTDQTMV